MGNRSVFINAFQPATELDDPDRFAGRARQVRELADALHIDGSVPVIFGHRGLGKSSLALQMRRIAMGDVELLAHLGAERLALADASQFLTFFVTCTDATRTTNDLLQLMINSAESVDFDPGQTHPGESRRLVDRSTRRAVSIKSFELESTERYQTESQRLSYQELNLEEKLIQLCDLLSATYRQPVLFVIDELDRMETTGGLASFLKAASSTALKFMLVGIASDIANLLHDHQSLERRLMTVRLPLMTQPELGQIVVKAQSYVREHGLTINFEDEAVLTLVKVSAGFPWFVHVFGQQALIDAEEEGTTVVTRESVSEAISQVASNRFAQQFSDMYQMAVRDSWNREATLRMFAEWPSPDIPTSEIYRRLSSIGVKGGGTYRGHLCQAEYGSILMVPDFQKRGLIRFRNEMFKAYVRLRPSLYAGLDDQVRATW